MATKDKKGPEKVGDLLGAYLSKSGLREAVVRSEAVDEWREKVGASIADVTRARGIQGSTLIVEVRSSAWLMELNLVKNEILRRVNEGRKEGFIEKLVFVLAEEPAE
jgi:predicted nucleic acid-binding Zn ribbon protein